MNTNLTNNNKIGTFASGVAISSLVFGMCLLASPAKAQNAGNQAPPAQDQQSQGPGPGQDNQGGSSNGQPSNGQPSNGQPGYTIPPNLTIPAGTVVFARVNQWISSDKNQPGDIFSATLDQPIIASGWVVARRGQAITGQVTVAQKASHGGVSQLGVELNEITLVDGQVVPTMTEMVKGTPRPTPPGRDVNIVGTTTGIGAVVGAITYGGAGAAIGAGLGATAGLIGVLSTRGNPTIIYPESVLTFRLDNPVEVSTAGSEAAFQPVNQDDYGQQQAGPGSPQLARRPPPPYAPYYAPYPYAYYGAPYPYPYYGYYPAPFAFGFYGSFGPGYYYGRGRYFRR